MQPDPEATHEEDAAFYRSILHGFIDMGNDLAQRVHAQALAETASPGETQSAIQAFDTVTRTVRRTILLAQRVAERPRPASPDPAARRTAARKRIIRVVEDSINQVAPDQAETLDAELRERLDSPDLDLEIDTRPLEDVIADIRFDLGLANIPGYHRRRTPAQIDHLNARAEHQHRRMGETHQDTNPNARPKRRMGETHQDTDPNAGPKRRMGETHQDQNPTNTAKEPQLPTPPQTHDDKRPSAPPGKDPPGSSRQSDIALMDHLLGRT